MSSCWKLVILISQPIAYHAKFPESETTFFGWLKWVIHLNEWLSHESLIDEWLISGKKFSNHGRLMPWYQSADSPKIYFIIFFDKSVSRNYRLNMNWSETHLLFKKNTRWTCIVFVVSKKLGLQSKRQRDGNVYWLIHSFARSSIIVLFWDHTGKTWKCWGQ